MKLPLSVWVTSASPCRSNSPLRRERFGLDVDRAKVDAITQGAVYQTH